MSLPRFLDRILDAAVPALGGIDRDAVRARLEGTRVTLAVGDLQPGSAEAVGFGLTANLAARLYPEIQLAGPDVIIGPTGDEIRRVNPNAVLSVTESSTSPTLAYEAPEFDGPGVSVFARGWNVFVDEQPDAGEGPTSPLAGMLAGVLGASELFRIVFEEELGERGRRNPQPGAFNLVTLGDAVEDLPVPAVIEIESARLVGAGAIGQAAALALAEGGARGRLLVVDPEAIELSNLQRYVLAGDADVGTMKVELIQARLEASQLDVHTVPEHWTATLVDGQQPTMVALDSPQDRIGVQASLPGPIYNAWTQPADVGWSRHEHFGTSPCLACLYWPAEKSPSRHEQIAAAFGQHPVRVLAYLVSTLPVGLPLPAPAIPAIPELPVAPDEAQAWVETPIVSDIAAIAGVAPEALAAWAGRPIGDVYQAGICGGALLHLDVGHGQQEVLVPLAHQSAFAGVMLAAQFLISSVPELAKHRPEPIEGRFDVLAGMPQVLRRPRRLTPGCLCSDSDFLTVYRKRFAIVGRGR